MAWKERPGHKPLLIRGSRQTGKTYLVEMFGKIHFQNLVTVNFEEMKELKKSFDQDLSPHLILRDISAWLNQVIIPGKTLLFLMRFKLAQTPS